MNAVAEWLKALCTQRRSSAGSNPASVRLLKWNFTTTKGK